MAHVRTDGPGKDAPRPTGDYGGGELSAAAKDLVRDLPERMTRLRSELSQRVFGQEETVEQLLTCFLAGGHALIIGVPGLAKTLMIRSLAELFDLDFARIQFTPDLMPTDITGTTILVRNDATGVREFRFREGPLFTHLLLADEINRTPPKTQSALLEAMEESQVTVGGKPHALAPPFFVLATQNPIEQEGTYPLPVTQLDRFLFQIDIDYPTPDTEFDIIATTTAVSQDPLTPILSHDEVLELLAVPKRVAIPARIVERATQLVRATRPDEDTKVSENTKDWLSWGAGPRAIQAILDAARARAVMDGRTEVQDQDYEEVILPALRHRVLLTYHAEAERVRSDQVIQRIREEIGDAPAARSNQDSKARAGRFAAWLDSWGDPAPRFRRV